MSNPDPTPPLDLGSLDDPGSPISLARACHDMEDAERYMVSPVEKIAEAIARERRRGEERLRRAIEAIEAAHRHEVELLGDPGIIETNQRGRVYAMEYAVDIARHAAGLPDAGKEGEG